MGENLSLTEAAARIQEFYNAKKRMPAVAEIAQIFGYTSKSSAHYLVAKLVQEGYYQKDETGRLIPADSKRSLKVLGSIQAGFPSPAEEELVDTLSLDEYLISNKEASFLLKVTGDSMMEAGIMPGDMVIVEKGKKPNSGDVVIAEVDGEWTMKYYEKHGNEIFLRPANAKYKVIKPKYELKVAGVVVATFRKFK